MSASLDRAIKAYVDHTQVVLAGDASLDTSYLAQPFEALANAANNIKHAALPNGDAVQEHEQDDEQDGKKKKTKGKTGPKPRDPNMPKRPVTAYFRYLSEVRPLLAKQMADTPGEKGKAGDLTRLATAQWNELSPEAKAHYSDAYKEERRAYEEKVKAYLAQKKQETGEGPEPVTLASLVKGDAAPQAGSDDEASSSDDDDDDDDDGDDDDDSASSSSEEDDFDEAPELPLPPPPKTTASRAKAKSGSPEAARKPAKPAPKKSTAAPVAPAASQKSNAAVAPRNSAPASSPPKKRKDRVTSAEEEPVPAKRSRKTDAQKIAALDEGAGAGYDDDKYIAAQLGSDITSPATKAKKEKKERKKKSIA